MTLNQGAADAHRRAAVQARAGASQSVHLEAAGLAAASADGWERVASVTGTLRSAHPSAASIQIERLDLVKLLEHANSRAARASAEQTARALSRAAESYAEVAEFHLRAVRGAHARGELLLTGRGLPHEALSRRPDLLHAKLTDRVVVAPNAVLRQLESVYRAVGSQRGGGLRGGTPPAA